MRSEVRSQKLAIRSRKPGMLFMFSFCIFFSLFCSAQRVPSEMKIGDVKLHINENARKQIQQDVDRLTRSDTYFQILVDRMNLYFHFIEREHEKGNIPEEIKFLAIQESALISDAVSSANAVGFWQFKDFTGREVGLRVDRDVDERLNIVAASRGSSKYFKTNNFFFDNWAYAIIAYQAGAAGAKKHTNEKYYGAKKLNITTKTYWYLKKFIAHYIAFSPYVGTPHSENIWLAEVTDAGGKSLQQIAREEKVDLEELKKYNKWLKRGKVPTDKKYSVMIPRTGQRPKKTVAANKRARPTKIQEAEKKVYPTEIKAGITNAERATIIPINGISSILSKKTDDVHTISARAGISEGKFRKYNDMSSDDTIIPNEFYYIKKKKGKSKVGIHVVARGESLWGISQQYGIKLLSLAKKNRMSIIDEVKTGRVLWMSKTRPSDEPVAYHKTSSVQTNNTLKSSESVSVSSPKLDSTEEDVSEEISEEVAPIEVPYVDSSAERRKVKIHTVAKGESLWSISQHYEVKVDDLLRWNELPDPNAISIGQNIQVKAPIEEASIGKSIITHKVEAGETLYAISRKYGMTVDEVMDLNGMKDFNLDSGQELKVYAEE